MVARVGDASQQAAVARDVEVEGRVGAERGHHRGAWLQREAADQAEKAVDAWTDGDMGGGHAVVGGEGLLQVVVLRVAVHPGIGGGRLHRGDGAGGGAEKAFVRPEPGTEGGAGAAFKGLGAGEGDGRGEPVGVGGQKAGHGGRLARVGAAGKGAARAWALDEP